MCTHNSLKAPESRTYLPVIWRFLLTAIFFYCLFTIYAVFKTPVWGWDIDATCPCLTAIQDHENPYSSDYVQRHYQTHLSCTYQPATYYMLLLPCKLLTYGKVASVGLLWIGGLLLLYKLINDVFVFATIMLGAFSGFPFYLLTGNLGASLEFFLLCLFINFFHRQKYFFATFMLSTFGFVKIIPLLILIPYLWFLKKELKMNLSRHLFAVVGTLVVLFGVSALSGWRLFLDHFKLLLGGVPGQLSPINEISFGWSNPTLLLFFRGLAEGMPGITLYLVIVVIVLLAVRHVTYASTVPIIQKLMFLLLALFLILPRTKPYFFISCAPLLYIALISISSRLRKIVLLGVALIYPLLAFNVVLDNGLATPINDFFGGASIFSLGLTVVTMYFFLLGKSAIPGWLIEHASKLPPVCRKRTSEDR